MYTGQIINIPLGQMGLYTDDAQTITPPQGLLQGENIEIAHGFISKAAGSARWNSAAKLPTGVAQFIDWWPDDITQRMIVVTNDGKVWRFQNAFGFTEVKPVNGAPVSLKVTQPVMMVAGGNEEQGNPRKLFIFTGNDPVQVISGDGTTRSNMSLPALDWTNSFQPSFGIIVQNRLWCFGNKNNPHFVYGSNPSNQEDFQTNGAVVFVNVFPGDADGLVSAYNYKGVFLLFKYPFGYYNLDLSNPLSPVPTKLGNSFGAGSPFSVVQAIDDLYVGNSSGSITAGSATNALGGIIQSDVIKMNKFSQYMAQNVAPLKNKSQNAIWYDAKKTAMFSYYSPSGQLPDRILMMDFQSGRPRASMSTKDQPNCLGLVKDINLIQRPFYGSNDGYIYAMDQKDKNVGGNSYEMNFQLPYLDFGFVQQGLSETMKNFDFLEISFQPSGNWTLSADVYIDNVFIETVTFTLSQSDVLDSTFTLDESRLSGPGPRSQRRPIHGQGRRISVIFYQSGLNQNVDVSGVTFYFRASAQQQRSS